MPIGRTHKYKDNINNELDGEIIPVQQCFLILLVFMHFGGTSHDGEDTAVISFHSLA